MRDLTAAAPDPEAPPPAPCARACRPLDWLLGLALLLLTAAWAACAVRSWAAPAAASPRPLTGPAPSLGTPRSNHPKDGFAQLVASNVLLTNGTLLWHSDQGLAGVFLAGDLRYEERDRQLVVEEAGVYEVFLHLELQRVLASDYGGYEDSDRPGWVSADLRLQPGRSSALTLRVALPAASSDLAEGSRNRLLRLRAGQRLSVHLRTSATAHPTWQLAQGATVLSLFRVATGDPSEPRLPWPRPT
ncbi:tumor necrosis factor ligand superfamily member 9 [Echinops telfairi]|uniref:Tumor necrosis factor ligand superfamily member 9 n=1 Tax=Echinops telfairi TaxID=9371 RepID=A0AC55DW71_ECHTE|nr:tumor necrosis factor ligand superfamily member 9 [Echinops telfairi]